MKTFLMLLHEKRRNVQQNNNRENFYEYLLRLYREHKLEKKEGFENLYLTLTSVPKLGINPINEYNTPTGIYCYRLVDYIELILDHKTLNVLPFIPDNTQYLIFFSLVNQENIIFTNRYSAQQYNKDKLLLKQYYENMCSFYKPNLTNTNEALDKKIAYLKNLILLLNKKEKPKTYLNIKKIYEDVYKKHFGVDSPEQKSEYSLFKEKFKNAAATIITNKFENLYTLNHVMLDCIYSDFALFNESVVKELKHYIKLEGLTKEEQTFYNSVIIPLAKDAEVFKKNAGRCDLTVFYTAMAIKENIKKLLAVLTDQNDIHLLKENLKELSSQIAQRLFSIEKKSRAPEIKRIEALIEKLESNKNHLHAIKNITSHKLPTFSEILRMASEKTNLFGLHDVIPVMDNSIDVNQLTTSSGKRFFKIWKISRFIAIILSTTKQALPMNLWSTILTKILKMNAVVDSFGIIHPNEIKQTVVLNHKIIKPQKILNYSLKLKSELNDLSTLPRIFYLARTLQELFVWQEFKHEAILTNMHKLNDIFEILLTNEDVLEKIKNKQHWIYELYYGVYGKTRKIPQKFRKEHGDWWDRIMKNLRESSHENI